MLDGGYKWLRRLRERRFFLPDMERMFSLSPIQSMSLHRSMEWDLTEEQSEASLGQIFLHTAIPTNQDRNIIGLLLSSLEAKNPIGEPHIRRPCSLTSLWP